MSDMSDGRLLPHKVADRLKARLRKLSAGSRLSPEPELAREFRVSRSTLRAALSLLEREGFVTRKKRVGTVVRERPARRTSCLGLLCPKETHELSFSSFYDRVIRGIRERCAEGGWDMVTLLGSLGRKVSPESVRALRRDGFDGLFAFELFDRACLRELSSFDRPVVAVDVDATTLGLASVAFDNLRAGELAARHLALLGHGRLAFFGPVVGGRLWSDPAYGERLDGFRRAAREAGAQVELLGTDDPGGTEAPFDVSGATGFFCPDTRYAKTLAKALKALGKSIPQDASVVALSSGEEGAADWTRVVFDAAELGREAAAMLEEMVEGGHGTELRTVRPDMVQGKSTCERR